MSGESSNLKIAAKSQPDPENKELERGISPVNALVNYIFAPVENDVRPHLNVFIFGVKLRGLLDSGASRTIVGGPGWDMLKNMGLVLRKSEAEKVSLANGGSVRVLGEVSLPIQLENRVKVFEVLVILELPHTIFLGIDF